MFKLILGIIDEYKNRLCGLVVRVLGYRSGGPGSIPGTSRKKKGMGLERGPLSLLSTTEKLLELMSTTILRSQQCFSVLY
jgi:hypothetical protein